MAGVLKSVLATSLSPSQEDFILENAPHVLNLLVSNPAVLGNADESTLSKFRVRISALIKSKKPISRWFGCYLCKVVIESSSCWAMLKSHGSSWVGSILHLLEIPEPLVTHEIAIEALSALFARTVGKPSMTREITTPKLPDYIKALLNLAAKEKQLHRCIVPALTRVLQNQSTTFRSHAKRFEQLIFAVLSEACESPQNVEPQLLKDACKAFVSLHNAASKGTEIEEWRAQIIVTINEIHFTLSAFVDPVFNEDFNPASITGSRGLLQSVQGSLVDKLHVLLSILEAFFVVPTKYAVKVPFGAIVQLSDRLYQLPFSAPKPISDQDSRATAVYQLEHINARLTHLVVMIMSTVSGALVQSHFEHFLHHITVTVGRSKNIVLKLELLNLAAFMFEKVSLVPADFTEDISQLINASLQLLVPQKPPATTAIPDFVTQPHLFEDPPHRAVIECVDKFITAVVVSVPALPLAQRTAIDRYAILQRKSNTGVLSSLYPGVATKFSILPMALRNHSTDVRLMQLIHPRFPPLMTSQDGLNKQVSIFGSGNSSGETEEEDVDMNGDMTDEQNPRQISRLEEMQQREPSHIAPYVPTNEEEQAEPSVETVPSVTQPQAPAPSMFTPPTTQLFVPPADEPIAPAPEPTLAQSSVPIPAETLEDDDGDIVIPEFDEESSDEEM
ncbi:hypothetical protein TRVA0_001S10000 [Trichomonascus vanleenenianus]|uniref:Rix1p n=1 Tax=Trichomonascus vanleenenianus TaxID=2268995 RepID=UPI003EC9A663